MTDALGWIERLRGADSQLFSGSSTGSNGGGPAGSSGTSRGHFIDNQGGREGSMAGSASRGWASDISSSEFGEPARIGGVRASKASAGRSAFADIGQGADRPGYTAAANETSSSASGAPGIASSFKDFFQGRADDTHPPPRVYGGRQDTFDDVSAAMQRVNESRGRASSSELQEMEMGEAGRTRSGSLPTSTMGLQGAGNTGRSSHWNVTDGDLYKMVSSYIRGQKD